MKNTFINNYRRNQKTRNTFDGNEDALRSAYRRNFASETPEMVHSVTEMTRHIETLDDDFRIPFKMHTDGYKYKEIAEQLELPIGTVKVVFSLPAKSCRRCCATAKEVTPIDKKFPAI